MIEKNENQIDFIGDIHGHADKLKELLGKLGYTEDKGIFSHPERSVLFVGDYIDRGPKIPETLQIVKGMVDSKNAVALMGNHEYNALCFDYPDKKGGHLRPHLIKNVMQHYQTLKQFQNRQHEYEHYLEWFKTLPLFYETNTFRAVHACWDDKYIDRLQKELANNCMDEYSLYRSVKKHSKFHNAIENTLKGKEIELPEGKTFMDKDDTTRKKIRIKWWLNPANTSYQKISVLPIDGLQDEQVGIKNARFYRKSHKPVFFGHYWLNGDPSLYRTNICCLDYSVAKEGKLVAYRFNGEQELSKNNLVYV